MDTDVLARNLTACGGKAYNELVEHFGREILDENGEINRKKLASIAFGDMDELQALNCITHKYVAEKISDTVNILKNSGKWDIIVIDAPIPIEKGFLDTADEVWVVMAEREKRIKRVMDRSGYTYEEAVSRINSQLSDEDYLKIADEVLYNNGSMEELEQAAVRLFLKKKQDWQR